MAWFLFIDESGHDRKASPYEVLAGAAIQDRVVSSVISQLQEAGQHRATRIISEPFFVHSDLTTGVQIADLVAYVVSWGFRTPQMTKPARAELAGFAKQIAGLRYRAVRERLGNPRFVIWSFARISDLRTQSERDDGQ